jgi:hypothetical protein
VTFAVSDAVSKLGHNGAAFVEAGENTARKLFVYDLTTGELRLVGGSAGNAMQNLHMTNNTFNGYTADSKFLLFSADNAGVMGNNAQAFTDTQSTLSDVFAYELATGHITLITHDSLSGNRQSSAASAAAFIGTTADSRYVLFSSLDASGYGNNGVAFTDASPNVGDVFAYDMMTQHIHLVSRSAAPGNLASANAGITGTGLSTDGRYAFLTTADVSLFGNEGFSFIDSSRSQSDVLAYELATGRLQLLTHSAAAGNITATSTTSSTFLGSNGQIAVFGNVNATGFGNNGIAFTDAAPAGTDLFAVNLNTGLIQLVTHNSAVGNLSSSGNAVYQGMSADGNYVFFTANDATQYGNNGTAFIDNNASNANLFAYDVQTGEIRLMDASATNANTVGSGGAVTFAGVSQDGNYVLFNVGTLSTLGNGPAGSGTAYVDAGASNDLISVRLNLLDLNSNSDTGLSNVDNITSATNLLLHGLVAPNQFVQLFDEWSEKVVATGTANAHGQVDFNLTNVSEGLHNYSLLDAGNNTLTMALGLNSGSHLMVTVI